MRAVPWLAVALTGCGIPTGSVTVRSFEDDFQMAMLKAAGAQQERIEAVLNLLIELSRERGGRTVCPTARTRRGDE